MSNRGDGGRVQGARDLSKVKLDDLITRAQFAEMIGKSPTRVSQMLLKEGNDLPEPIRLGRDTMWVRQEAEDYAAAHPPAASSSSSDED